MEEDVGVPAKVTRLRRRLSVEQSDDVSSPSTPTKKRGGRLAAKPQLELIDENAQVSSPRKAKRKSVVKDVADEEKPLTPSRRSTRVKSNTSIVLETLSAQVTDSPRAKRALRRNSTAGSDNEGPVTPARQTRKARKDSASSVENQEPAPVNRPLQVVEMVIDEEPENEDQKPTRKSKGEGPNKSVEKLSPDSARKSKRLLEKRNRRSGSLVSEHDSSVTEMESNSLNASVKNEDSETKSQNKSRKSVESNNSENISGTERKSHNKSRKSESAESEVSEAEKKTYNKPRKSVEIKETGISETETKPQKSKKSIDSTESEFAEAEEKKHNKSKKSIESNETKSQSSSESGTKSDKSRKSSNESGKLSESNMNLLEAIDSESNIKTSKHNKSTSTLHTQQNDKKKRNRTESWPCLVVSPSRDNIVFSDNEQVKKKKRKSNITFMNNSSLNSTSTKEESSDVTQNEEECSTTLLDIFKKRKKRQSEVSLANNAEITAEAVETPENPVQSESNNQNSTTRPPNENTERMPEDTGMSSEMAILFQNPPSNVQAIVYFEDSDSNSVSTETTKKIKGLDNEDQCVPEMTHVLESPKPTIVLNTDDNIFLPKPNEKDVPDSSCEPMDIDESINDEILQKSQDMLQESTIERKSLSLHQSGIIEGSKKSKRKSSLTSSNTPDRSDLVVSGNENKSTLILSQIKDVSGTSENAQQSPITATTELLSNNSDINTSNKISTTNISSNDLKGTPFKQKSMLKLAMQTSTPFNTPQNENKTKVEEKNVSKNKNDSSMSKSIDETVSDEDSDEESGHKSKLLDDEAEEASDDYESGDSRDEEERQYEEENEIVERGETLGSDDEASNDTDYEKDSFVVSSDEEDDDLLSGSGDDLSMSDNELSMSKKSKKKYNERKLKEQKAASREMYESRHKLNTSDSKSPAPKTKNNRMRIDSSLIESDEEVVVTSKKKNRLRLDSTLDTSTKQGDTNESLNKSKKKRNKSLQDSICNQSAINEKEITVCNETAAVTDPLQVMFKQEPKTPQRDLNISVVQFTDRQDIENVEVAESNSILNRTESDPLQATMACEDSDSSESEEIMQNYDSVLNELNANKKSKLSANNISLNIDKKSKKDKNETIIDQLNLTNTKKSNIKSVKSEDVVDSSKVMLALDNEDSSDSIDLQLLFSEDNCGSGDENNGEEELFVPLRKSTGKTDIRESLGVNTSQQNSSLNESRKKRKKRKSSLPSEDTAKPADANKSQDNTTLNESKENRKSSITSTGPLEETQDCPKVEIVLNESLKKKKKRKSSLVVEDLQPEGGLFFIDTTGSLATEKEEKSDYNKAPMEVLYVSEKKKNKKSDLSQNIETNAIGEPSPKYKPNTPNMKKKNKKQLETSVLADNDSDDAPEEVTCRSEKASNQDTEQNTEAVAEPAEKGSGKKKKKRKKKTSTVSEPSEEKSELSQNIEIHTIGEPSPKSKPNTPNMMKKNKRHLETSVVADNDSDDAPEEMTYRSEKASNQETEQPTEAVIAPAESGSGKKKKKKKKKTSIVSEPSVESTVSDEPQSSKKRKRKSSDTGAQSSTQAIQEVVAGLLNEPTGSNKKKRKISHSSETNEQINTEDVSGDHEKKSKKKHKKNMEFNYEITVPETEIAPTQVKKNKKRKERDEENDSKQTKVTKENSFHEVHNVPSTNTTSRHQDNPKKSKVISTSNFVVENTRQKRAKPSNYLEESIYLNDDTPFGKKEKPRMKKPNVLPFVPTASISESGYTTNFKINKLSQNVQFVAEPAGISFSKESYLQRKEIKRLGTYDRYKKQINRKLSKF